MTFDVLDETTLARLGNIDVWVSVYWDEPYNSEGSFTLEVRPTPRKHGTAAGGPLARPHRRCNENPHAHLSPEQ